MSSKRKFSYPTDEEDAVIRRGIAVDPDSRKLSDEEFERLRPFEAVMAKRCAGRPPAEFANEMADVVKAKVRVGEYANESDDARDEPHALLTRNCAVGRWVREQAGPAYDKLKADPSRAVTADHVRARLASPWSSARKEAADTSNVDTRTRRVTKAGTNLFAELGFESEEANGYQEQFRAKTVAVRSNARGGATKGQERDIPAATRPACTFGECDD
jgi:Arc/MetJ-type ribon-helix-helix transcriptional regulator